MAQNNVLRWLDGRGWLVFCGGHDASSEVRALALGRASADGGVAYISFGSGELGEQALMDMEDLGAPSGYLVDVLTEDDQTIQNKLADAGIIVVESGISAAVVRSALLGAAVEGMKVAYQHGAVILAEGFSAAVFGAWITGDAASPVAGLAWFENIVVVPGITTAEQSREVQAILSSQPAAIAVGIGLDSALALGPDGEVETWGKRQVTVTLGRNYTG
jgi:hypothetical protein